MAAEQGFATDLVDPGLAQQRAAMGDYDDQIRILADAMEAMQGRVLAEQAAAQAEQQRR